MREEICNEKKKKEYEKSLRLWNEFESSFLGINFKQSRTWKHFGFGQGMENYLIFKII